MKIRRLFESMTDPDDMFEIFKDIVEDVLLIEFDDKDINETFIKGQIALTRQVEVILTGSRDDDFNEYTKEDNWGYSFFMPDRKEDKKRIQKRIVDLFKMQTGVELDFIEMGDPLYNHQSPTVGVIYSKKEWVGYIKSLKDFEEMIDDTNDYIPQKYKDIEVIGNFYYHKMTNQSFCYIFKTGVGLGLKINLNRGEYLDELKIKDGVFAYDVDFNPVCYYGGTWMVLTEGMDKVEDKVTPASANAGSIKDRINWFAANRNYVPIDEYKKQQLLKASNQLNSTISTLEIDLDGNYEDNLKKYSDMLITKVFPLIANKDSELISQVEEQISKLEKEDNLVIDYEIVKNYIDSNKKYIVWLLETDYKGGHYIFKITLDVSLGQISIHNNKDENSDGPTILKCPINEFAVALFLCLVDNKLSHK